MMNIFDEILVNKIKKAIKLKSRKFKVPIKSNPSIDGLDPIDIETVELIEIFNIIDSVLKECSEPRIIEEVIKNNKCE